MVGGGFGSGGPTGHMTYVLYCLYSTWVGRGGEGWSETIPYNWSFPVYVSIVLFHQSHGVGGGSYFAKGYTIYSSIHSYFAWKIFPVYVYIVLLYLYIYIHPTPPPPTPSPPHLYFPHLLYTCRGWAGGGWMWLIKTILLIYFAWRIFPVYDYMTIFH